jgi:hypothetical protein
MPFDIRVRVIDRDRSTRGQKKGCSTGPDNPATKAGGVCIFHQNNPGFRGEAAAIPPQHVMRSRSMTHSASDTVILGNSS